MKFLSGKIMYKTSSSDLNNVNSYIKLKNDPKGEIITIQNVIWRGSVLY